MSVVISNTSTHDDLEGENFYEVRIAGRLIATFTHVRRDGMAECLRRAAEAVESGRAVRLSTGAAAPLGGRRARADGRQGRARSPDDERRGAADRQGAAPDAGCRHGGAHGGEGAGGVRMAGAGGLVTTH